MIGLLRGRARPAGRGPARFTRWMARDVLTATDRMLTGTDEGSTVELIMPRWWDLRRWLAWWRADARVTKVVGEHVFVLRARTVRRAPFHVRE